MFVTKLQLAAHAHFQLFFSNSDVSNLSIVFDGVGKWDLGRTSMPAFTINIVFPCKGICTRDLTIRYDQHYYNCIYIYINRKKAYDFDTA